MDDGVFRIDYHKQNGIQSQWAVSLFQAQHKAIRCENPCSEIHFEGWLTWLIYLNKIVIMQAVNFGNGFEIECFYEGDGRRASEKSQIIPHNFA